MTPVQGLSFPSSQFVSRCRCLRVSLLGKLGRRFEMSAPGPAPPHSVCRRPGTAQALSRAARPSVAVAQPATARRGVGAATGQKSGGDWSRSGPAASVAAQSTPPWQCDERLAWGLAAGLTVDRVADFTTASLIGLFAALGCPLSASYKAYTET